MYWLYIQLFALDHVLGLREGENQRSLLHRVGHTMQKDEQDEQMNKMNKEIIIY